MVRVSVMLGLAGRVDSLGPLQVRPCKLGRRLLVCTVLHTARPGLGIRPNPPEACLGPMRHAPSQPTRPATDSFLRRHRRKRKKKIRAKAAATAARCGLGSDPFSEGKRIRPLLDFRYLIHAWRGSTAVTGKLSEAGRADGGTVHGMDAVAEPTGTYLRRVPPSAPSPPDQQKSRAAFEVVVAVA